MHQLNGAFVTTITNINATKEKAKLIKLESDLDSGKIYLGTLTFFISVAAHVMDDKQRFVTSDAKNQIEKVLKISL